MPAPDPLGDRIELRGLRVVGTIGVLPEERERAQPFEVDLDVWADLSRAGRTDDLGDTIDYGAITAEVAGVVGNERHELLERVAQRIVDVVLDGHPMVDAVSITIRKTRPPVALDLATSAVRITRWRAR